jgi:hypothetical protein
MHTCCMRCYMCCCACHACHTAQSTVAPCNATLAANKFHFTTFTCKCRAPPTAATPFATSSAYCKVQPCSNKEEFLLEQSHLDTPSIDTSLHWLPVGANGPVDASCSLLTNTTDSLPAQLQLQPDSPWPAVLDNFSTQDTIQLRSTAWLCIQSAAAWDTFGAASHELIHTGRAGESAV